MAALMVQGTTSDAGKSTLVAGLCRLMAKRGYRVAPFKPQNMALNSAVTEDGGEIGRAQAVQAFACGLEPHSDMNPVLIKPASDTHAQIIIQGQVQQNMSAQNFHQFKPHALQKVLQSYRRLQQNYSCVLIEGAGSPAEINLRQGDIANMGFAEAADCPVILIADINPGGVFAHIVGTLELLTPPERDRIKGFVINRFRGDIALLESGLDWLEKKTAKPVLGVLPWLHNFHLEAEDAINTEQLNPAAKFRIVVPVLPHISNHTDFDALRFHPNVHLEFIDITTPQIAADLIILPGSKNVPRDLEALLNNGWQQKLHKHLRYGGKLIGICGGYQMLGEHIKDPLGIEAEPSTSVGFGLLPISTELRPQKQLKTISGKLTLNNTVRTFTGYEIHQGCSSLTEVATQPLELNDNSHDGCVSDDNAIFGSYCHGIFDNAAACNLMLSWAGLSDPSAIDIKVLQNEQLERLANTLEASLDIEKIIRISEGRE